MALGSVLKNFNIFFDGHGFAGKVAECTPPKLKLKTEEYRAGGMDAPVDITQGMEKITTDFSVKDFSPLLLGSLTPREGSHHTFTFRGALEDYTGTVKSRVLVMRGKVTEIDAGSAKAGEGGQIKLSMTLDYYSDMLGGQVITEIDVINMTYLNNGSDALAEIRNAIGM